MVVHVYSRVATIGTMVDCKNGRVPWYHWYCVYVRTRVWYGRSIHVYVQGPKYNTMAISQKRVNYVVLQLSD